MICGHSSAGRAPVWHAEGQRFNSAWLNHDLFVIPISLNVYKPFYMGYFISKSVLIYARYASNSAW
tara:strand:- start:617 stop:814 length:198 start_codon:yes stop_codon:yes gene_type:complete